MTQLSKSGGTTVLIPVYNDWEGLPLLLDGINASAQGASVLVIDDGSTDQADWDAFQNSRWPELSSLEILTLGRNLGHQMAIAVGLGAVVKDEADTDSLKRSQKVIVIVDGDGEDAPADIPRLVQECAARGFNEVVFARRSRRSEGVFFRFCYFWYTLVYRTLTGGSIFFGNFSAVPLHAARQLVLRPELWSHYAATVIKSQIRWASISTVRAKRLKGSSKMNLTKLVIHGLSAVAVHSDTVAIRGVLVSIFTFLAGCVLIGTLLSIRLFTGLAIPGWTSTLLLSIANIMFQAFSSSLLLAFLVLGSRSSVSLTPAAGFAQFVSSRRKVF